MKKIKYFIIKILTWLLQNHITNKEVLDYFWDEYKAYAFLKNKKTLDKDCIENAVLRTINDFIVLKKR